MAETYSLRITPSCAAPADGQGALACFCDYHFTPGGGPAGDEVATILYLLDDQGQQVRQAPAGRDATTDLTSLANGYYTVEWREADSQRLLAANGASLSCGAGTNLQLDNARATAETAAGGDGTATIQASSGTAPLTASVVELSLSQPAASGQPSVFTGLPASAYTLRVTDSSTPTPQVVQAIVAVAAYAPPVAGCQDAYADNYDPAATSGGAAACTYSPRWRSAWGPQGLAVRVPAVAGQVVGFLTAKLRIGFRPGHPLAARRPLGAPLVLRATVGPDGYATFRLAPYLWPALGAPDGEGGYRLDLNAQAVDDGYVGYELRRDTGELLEHGYAVNAAVPDALLVEGVLLTGFASVPAWPGFEWPRPQLASVSAGQYGRIEEVTAPTTYLPCPANPLPVAWLNKWGGFDYWVFSGRPQLGDEVGESQAFTEPASGQRRYAQRGEARATTTASTGVFSGPLFGEGLRGLWTSPQVWYQPVAGGEWVAVTLEGGSFPVRRVGLPRTELTLTFTEAVPHYAQGQ